MPQLDTSLHLEMYRAFKNRSFLVRIRRAIRALGATDTISARIGRAANILAARDTLYGLQWGDPDSSPPLRYVRDHFVLQYVGPDCTAVEIGPGGGRWTRYVLGAKRLYAVDYHGELLDELATRFHPENLVLVKNNGADFPGIPDESVDFVFSFGTFVHFDIDLIDRYLANLRRILRAGATVVIQYSDKSKPRGRAAKTFSENDPVVMRRLVVARGYTVHEEDVTTLGHSSIIRFGVNGATGDRTQGP